MRKLAAILLAVSVTGCATMFTGSSKNVTISSKPAKAKIYLNGSYRGKTPLNLSLNTNKDYNIRVSKRGYEEAHAQVSRVFNAAAILNLLSPLCWIVDFATGAVWTFDEAEIKVELERK